MTRRLQSHDLTADDLASMLAALPKVGDATTVPGLRVSPWMQANDLLEAVTAAGYDIRAHDDRLTNQEQRILWNCADRLREDVHRIAGDRGHNHHLCLHVVDLGEHFRDPS